jgi:hypothetical protein
MMMVAVAFCRRSRRGGTGCHHRCRHDRENLFHPIASALALPLNARISISFRAKELQAGPTRTQKDYPKFH